MTRLKPLLTSPGLNASTWKVLELEKESGNKKERDKSVHAHVGVSQHLLMSGPCPRKEIWMRYKSIDLFVSKTGRRSAD